MQSLYIIISLSKRILQLYQNHNSLYQFPIAIGKQQTPTPTGNWYIINKKILLEPNIFGSRWLGLNNLGYGIHGTNAPNLIGFAVSHGCIRMHNADIEQLFSSVSIGTPVIIVP